MIINGWKIYHFHLFDGILKGLKQEVVDLKKSDPDNFPSHPKAKLLAKVVKAIREIVPTDPGDPAFRLGTTLGGNYTAWRRVKHNLPQRYRLFFRYSQKDKVIIYVWLNDETCLRKTGAKTDVYATFRGMLESGCVDNEIDDLKKSSVVPKSVAPK